MTWFSLRKLAHAERHILVPAIAIICCTVLLFGWIFSFDSIFRLFFTLLSASVSLSLLFERENTQHKLGIMYERMEVLQHHVMSLQSNPAVPNVVGHEHCSPTSTSRAAPAIPDMFGQSSMQGIVKPVIPEENVSDVSEGPILGLGDDSTEHRRQPGLPLKLSNPVSAARHADDIGDTVQVEREEMARKLQAVREEARAEKEALEQQVLVERRRADDELARVRAELDHEKQQRNHDEEMRREAETQRILECDEETRQQLYNITDLLLAEREEYQVRLERDEEMRQVLSEIIDLILAHREEFARKKEAVDERWEMEMEWREETNRQFEGLFNMVQGIIEDNAEERERVFLRRRSDSSSEGSREVA